ncbi:aldose 1-epimerase [Nocardia sp. GAS34]
MAQEDSVTDHELDLSAGAARLTVNAATGRIARFRVGEADVLHTGAHFGCFPMAPWCGRMREGVLEFGGHTYQLPRNAEPHAIHGTVRDHPWEVVRHNDTELVLAQDLRAPWPFAGRVTQSFALDADSAAFAMTVEAASDSFPAQAGWHPWFNRRLHAGGKDVEIAFAPAWQEQRGEDYLPTGHRIAPLPGPWDDCFGMPDGVDVTLTWPGALELTIASPLRWVVVYDLPPDTVCVEPQSGPPNGLNTDPAVVAPGAPLAAEMSWSWRGLA